MEEELGFGGQSLAKLFLVNYNALLDRETNSAWMWGISDVLSWESLKKRSWHSLGQVSPGFFHTDHFNFPKHLVTTPHSGSVAWWCWYLLPKSSSFPHCHSGTENYPSCCCLGNLFVENGDSLPCKTHVGTRNYLLIGWWTVQLFPMRSTPRPQELPAHTIWAICVLVCMSAFKMHKFGGTVSRFYSLICCYGISKDCQHLLLALKRFLDFEREYLPQRTLILILICNLTYFPSPYLLEVGKQNWWKSLC